MFPSQNDLKILIIMWKVLKIYLKANWIVKTSHFTIYQFVRVFGRLLESDLQPEITGASAIHFEYRQSQVDARTLLFHFIISIFSLDRVSGVFEQALNPNCRHRSCSLQDRRCPIKTAPFQFHSGGATTLCTLRKVDVDREVGKLSGKYKRKFLWWF